MKSLRRITSMDSIGALAYAKQLFLLSGVLFLSVFLQGNNLHGQSCNQVENFSAAITLAPTQTPGAWYVDRYAPFGFSSPSGDLGGATLKHSINVADGAVNRPGAYQTAFYNTQGRKYDLPAMTRTMQVDLYVPSAWGTSLKRHAGLWGTAFDIANVVSAYPIIEFTSDGGVPRFRGYESGGPGAWVNMGLPAGFVYDAWYTLEIEVLNNGEFLYTIGNLQYTTNTSSLDGSVRLANVILQGHNYDPNYVGAEAGDPGVTYDIYWDNFVTNLYPVKNTTQVLNYCTLQAAINAANPGDNIELLGNIFEGAVVVDEDITIDGNGFTLTSTSPLYGVEVTVANVTIQDLTIFDAGSFGFHASCGTDNLALTNVTVNSSGGTGITINGADNCVLTNITSTNNVGNGLSLTNCDNMTINGLTTSGNAFGGGFNAGIGLFTSAIYCLPAGINGFTLTGAVSIAETTKVYSQKANAADPITGLSGTTIEWAVGVGPLDRTYWPTKAIAYQVVKTLFEAPYSYPNTLVYVAEVATENFYVDDDPFGDATPPMLIQTAVTYEVPGKTIFLESGSYSERVTLDKSLTLDGSGMSGIGASILDGTGLAGAGSGITLNNGITNVTIKDLAVKNYVGAGPNSYAGIYAIGGNNNLTVTDVDLDANVGGSGFYANGPITDVLLNNVDAHGHTNVAGAARGIVIWNGLKSNVTITNCDVYGNNCCGIELQDGTATGVTMTGNNVHDNGDNGIGLVGLQGPGANLIQSNTVTDNGRFGIEIKNPDGSGASSGAGSIVVDDNDVTRTMAIGDARDISGIAVFRRGVMAGNVDVPEGVYVSNNTVTGYTQPSTSEGFGIVIEGISHTVTGNTVNGNDVGLQQQAGHLPYPGDGDQSNLADTYFGRGNAQMTCGNSVSLNTISGNTVNTRDVGVGGGLVTNMTTNETFCSIQSAIDDASTLAGHVISVGAGLYEETVVVNKSLTINGPNAAISGCGTRVAEAIISPPTSQPFFDGTTEVRLMEIEANNVTIKGLTFDGDNIDLTNSEGDPIDAADGIDVYSDVGGIIIQNNIFKNLNEGGINGFPSGVASFTGNTVSNNKFDNIPGDIGTGFPLSGYGIGVLIYNNFYADIENNCMNNVRIGVQTGNYNLSDAGNSRSIANNTIIFDAIGIWHNLLYQNASTFDITNNDVSANGIVNTSGVFISSIQNAVGVTVTNNDVSNSYAGVELWNNPTSNTVTINGGTILNGEIGVFANNYDGYSSNAAASSYIINGMDIDDCITGVYIKDNPLNTDPFATVALEMTNTTISSPTSINTGVLVSGPQASANIHNNPSTISNAGVGVDIDGGTATLFQNTITANEIGVQVKNGGNLTAVTENYITASFDDGIRIQSSAGTIGVINENDLSGNTLYAINNMKASPTVDATCNWFGSTMPAAVAAEVTGNVNYTPWLVSGMDGAVTDGFQASIACAACGLTLTTASTPADCPPATNGSASVTTVSGGTGSYSYVWNTIPVQTLATANNLAFGTYIVTVTDINGCSATASINVNFSGTGPVHNGMVSYCTIQDAIDDAAPGNTITVDAGTYAENIIVDKSLTILGPNSAINPCSGVRVAEAIVVPGTSAIASGEIFHVTASNVTISGFTIDGNNPSLMSGFLGTNGADLDAAEGVAVYDDNVSNLTVVRNIFKNLSYFGVTLYGGSFSAPATSGHLISENKMQDFGTYNLASGIGNWGGGVLLYNNQYAAVTNNCMENVRLGLQTGNFAQANPGTTAYQVISGNTISSRRRGVFHNLFYSAASPYTISGNTFTELHHVSDPVWDGVLFASMSVPSYGTNNTITGAAIPGKVTEGYEIWNVKSTSPVVISGGAVSNVSTGLFVNNYDGYPTAGSDAPDGGHASVSGLSISTVATGTGIHVKDNALSTHANVQLTIGAGVTVAGGATGLRVENASAFIVGGTLNNLAFIGTTGQYIDLVNNGGDLDATLATFEGFTGGVASLVDLFNIENKINHEIDNQSLGFVTVNSNNAYVTDINAAQTAINNDYTRIRNAVELVADNWTINLQGGFNWGEANALALWALGNDGVVSAADDYSILVPVGLDGVTFTAPQGLGFTSILGPDDLPGVNLEAALVFDGGPNQNWTISEMEFNGFDLSIGFFNGAGGTTAFNGTSINHNLFVIPTDLNASVAPVDVNQNIGLHYSFGANQTISNNIFQVYGDGVSNGANFSSTVCMQSNTSGGSVYNGLLITGNTTNVLLAQSANPQVVLGIWENGHAHTSNITVSNNSFNSAAMGNDPALNLQRGFRVTSHSGAGSTVTYSGNTVNGANIGFQWIEGSNFSAQLPVVFHRNTLTGNNVGVLVQSNGAATMTQNFIKNSISDGVKLVTVAPSMGMINDNDLAGNGGYAINNLTASTIGATCNWYGSAASGVVAAEVNGPVTYAPWLTNGADNDGGTAGFQPVPMSCSGAAVVINSAVPSAQTCSGTGSIIVTYSGGTAPYNIAWTGGSAMGITNPYTITGLVSGPYVITVTDANGSTATANATILYLPVTNTTDDPDTYYATIQAAIDAADPGEQISVCAGTYAEDIIVNESVSLLGPNSTMNPCTGGRAPEAIVVPATAAFGTGEVFHVAASGVTISGFTIDGDNPLLVTGHTNTTPADIDAAEGVTVYETGINNLTVTNNIIKNLSYFAVTLYDYPAGVPSTGHTISNNKIQDLGTYDTDAGAAALWGGGVLLYNNQYAAVTNNCMENVRIGVQTGNYYAANPGSASFQQISGNTISARRRGIFHNLFYTGSTPASPYTLSNNLITGVLNVNETASWDGILLASMGTIASTASNNDIDGSALSIPTTGISVWNCQTAPVISDGTITGVDLGINVNNFEGYPTAGSNAGNTFATIDGVTVTGATLAGIRINDNPSNTNYATVYAEVKGNTTVSGSPAGIEVLGSDATGNINGNPMSITGNAIGVDVGGGTTTLFRNSITANGTGVRVRGGGNLSSTSENFITNNTVEGIRIEADAGTVGQITNNNLSGNTGLAINDLLLSPSVIANCNWYGSPASGFVDGEISGDVQYAPWLTLGTDGDMGTDGFQPVIGACGGTLVVINSATQTGETCGGGDGSIEVNFAGGTAPYTIAWSGPESSSTPGVSSPYDIVSLSAGTYTITVTDVNGSTATAMATVLYLPVHNVTSNTYHPTIQSAINAADPAAPIDVIEVCAGTYAENVIVNKSVSLLGPNSGVLNNPCTGGRVAEAIVVPATSAISTGEIFHVAASNVTISGFTIDGDNTALASMFFGTNGADIDAAEGITVYETGINGLTATNNIIQNLSYFGVTLYDYPAGVPSSGHTIANNKIRNLGTYDAGSGIDYWGGGVLLYNNQYAAVTNNCMENVRLGIQTGNFWQANPGLPASQVISGNTMEVRRTGIFHNLHYTNASALTLSSNTVTALANGNETRWDGIALSSLSVPSVSIDNIINGGNIVVTILSKGYGVWNVKSLSPLVGSTITGGSVTGVDIGVFANNYEGYSSDAPDGAHATVTNVTITTKATGTGIRIFDSPSSTTHADVRLAVSGCTISGGLEGVRFEETAAGTVGGSINNNTISASAVGINVNSMVADASNICSIANNGITLLGQLAGSNPTTGMFLRKVTGTEAVTISGNTISGAFYGYVGYNMNTTPATDIDGGSISGVMQGVALLNIDPLTGAYAPSNSGVKNITMSGFAGAHPLLPNNNFHAGVYTFTGGPVTTATITSTLYNLNISGTGKPSQESAGIDNADFSTGAGNRQNITINECTIANNDNRGITIRGGNALVDINQCTLTNNGGDPYGLGGNDGFGIIVREGAVATVNNSFITNPAAVLGGYNVHAMATDMGASPSATLTANDNSLNPNGNLTSNLALNAGGTLNATCNWWGSGLAANITPYISGVVDYEPYLTTGVDNPIPPLAGFQPMPNACNGCNGGVTNTNTMVTYCTIQEAIDDPLTLNGHIITVAAGTYAEHVIITKALDIRGPNYGISGTSMSRVAEAIIVPEADVMPEDPWTEVVYINSSDVSFDGFKISGDNPLISGHLYAGMDLEKGQCVYSEGSNVQFRNNIVEKATTMGFYAGGGLASPHYYNLVVSNNKFENIHDLNQLGYGFAMYIQATTGLISGNTVLNSRAGIQVQPYQVVHAVTPVVTGNTFNVWRSGIYYNYAEVNASAWTINNNVINGINPPQAPTGPVRWQGIAAETIRSTSNGGTITNNTVNGNSLANPSYWWTRVGLHYTGDASTSPLLAYSNNTVSGVSYGMVHDAPADIIFTNNNLTATTQAIAIQRAFNSAGVQQLTGGIGNMNATGGNTINGVASGTATLPQLYDIEDAIYHKVDSCIFGLVRVIPQQIYVTLNSSSVQCGIDAAAATGDQVNIKPGSYTSSGMDASAKSVALSPGSSPGCVTLGGNMVLDANDALMMELNGTVACTGYDRFIVNGTVALGGADLNITLGYVPNNLDKYTIIVNDGADPVSGTFVQGSSMVVTFGMINYNFVINYAGGDGNDVVLEMCTGMTTITSALVVAENTPGNPASVPDAGFGATYVWTVSSGTITSGNSGNGSSVMTYTSGPTPPMAPFTMTIGVTVTDANGCVSTDEQVVTIITVGTSTLQWVPDNGAHGSCPAATNCTSNVICFGLQYTPGVSGFLTTYTTGFKTECLGDIPLGITPVMSNQSCVMSDNSFELNACSTIDSILFNSSGNAGMVPVVAGTPLILHKVCFDLDPPLALGIKEDLIINLSASIDLAGGGQYTEYPMYTTTTLSKAPPSEFGGPVPIASTVECVEFINTPTLPVVKDLCGTTLTGVLLSIVDSGPMVCSGTRVYNYRYTDSSGLIFDWSYTYTIDDNTAPTGTPPTAITGVNGCLPTQIEANNAFDAILAVGGYSDNCTGSIVAATLTNAAVSGTNCSWMITYTFSVADNCGNALPGQIYTRSGSDLTAPTGTAPASITGVNSCLPTQLEADAAFNAIIAVGGYSDNCSGNTVTASLTNAVVTGTNCSWMITYTFSVADNCGNALPGQIYTRSGSDQTAPTGIAPAAITGVNSCLPTQLEADAAFNAILAAGGYTDNCSGNTVTATLTNAAVTGTNCSWMITYTFSEADNCGNVLPGQVYTRSGSDITAPMVTTGSIAACYDSQAAAEAAAIAATIATDNCSMVTKTATTVTTACNFVITVTATDQCGNTATASYTTLNSCQVVRLKVFLEGPYNPTTNLMIPQMNINHVLPGQDKLLSPNNSVKLAAPYTPFGQPYTGAPWNYNGNGGPVYGDPLAPGAPMGVLPYPADVVDWVLVRVMENSMVPSVTDWRCAGWVHTDGEVTFPQTCATFNVNPSFDYYVMVEHRNHLAILSESFVDMPCGASVIDWNFTDGNSYQPTFRFGQKQVETPELPAYPAGIWAMHAANGEQISSRSAISSADRTTWRLLQNALGYGIGDFNMDVFTDSEDETMWKFNQNKSTGITFLPNQ